MNADNITIKDIAKAAGVSPATVSCCFTGTRNVKPETKARIMKVAEQMRYIPNASARNLRIHTSNRIGIILTGTEEFFNSNFLVGLSTILSPEKFSLNIAFSDNSAESECSIIDDFISQNVSGLIIRTCQPENTVFFESRVEHYHIPTVFIDRKPALSGCCCIEYDNYKTISYFMNLLKNNNYKNIGLFCGPLKFSSESDCLNAYNYFTTHHSPILTQYIYPTDFSKEDSFRKAFIALNDYNLQAAICTSENIANGVAVAASILNISVKTDLLLLVLANENWSLESNSHGIIYSSKSIYQMGLQAGKQIFELIHSNNSCRLASFTLSDGITERNNNICIRPPAPIIMKKPVTYADTLRIMVTNLNTSNSITILSKQFEQSTKIKLDFTMVPQQNILDSIIADNERTTPLFDIYMYDIPWLSFLVQNQLIADISEYIHRSPFNETNFFAHNLNNCKLKNQYYGIPVVGGSQIMFYRKDLFEDHKIRERFYKLHNKSLSLPTTWEEFNEIARFFTRKYNADSPTLYGTSIAAADSLCFAPEVFLRILSFRGCIWDKHHRIAMDSSENIRAFYSLLDTQKYCNPSIFDTSISDTISSFCHGDTAMLITYTERATEINNALSKNQIGSVGYSSVPGNVSINIGWNFGISPYTKKMQQIYKYFDWLASPDINNYLTILDGQTAHQIPYQKMEFRKLYPWMTYIEKSFSNSFDRIPPYKPKRLSIPQNKIDILLYQTFKDICIHHLTPEEALEKANIKGKELLKTYGYYPTPMIR